MQEAVSSVPVELGCVHAERFIEGSPLVVIEVHGDIDAEAEEAGPQLGLPVIQVLHTPTNACLAKNAHAGA